MDYKVTDTELISVADAIRDKSDTSEQLQWPTGFASAVTSIEAASDIPDADNIEY